MFYVATKTSNNIELDDHKKSEFVRYWKQLAPFGKWTYGGSDLVIDEPLVDELIKNFKDKVLDYVPVPLGHPMDSASLAELNKGELIELDKRDDGLYGLIEIRDQKTAENIDNKLLPNVSIAFDTKYRDKKANSVVGAVLQHIGLVTDPFIKGMKEFAPALSDQFSDVVVLSENPLKNQEKEDEMEFVKIKNDRDFAVEVKYEQGGEELVATVEPGEEVEVPKDQAEAVKKQLADAVVVSEGEQEDDEKDLSDQDKKDDGDKDGEAGGESSDESKELSDQEKLAAERAKLAQEKAEFAKEKAEAGYQKLLSEGKILPAQKEAFLGLASVSETQVQLSDTETKTVDTLLSEFFEAMPDMRLLSEDGDDNGNGDGGEEEVELSDQDKEAIERYNLDEETYKSTKKELEGEK